MRLLIPGGEGFVGSNFIAATPGAVPLDDRSFNKVSLPQTVVGDIRSPRMGELVRDCDAVLNFACRDIRTSMREPLPDAEVNIVGTLNLLTHCRAHNKPYFHVSSVSVETEASHYAISKKCAEYYVRFYRQWVPTYIVRLSNVFGPNDTESVIGRWLAGDTITLINGEQTRDFTYINDVVPALQAFIRLRPEVEVNIGTGISTRLGDLAKWLAERTGKPLLTIPPREIDNVSHRVVDTFNLRTVLGYTPRYDVYSGLEDYLKQVSA